MPEPQTEVPFSKSAQHKEIVNLVEVTKKQLATSTPIARSLVARDLTIGRARRDAYENKEDAVHQEKRAEHYKEESEQNKMTAERFKKEAEINEELSLEDGLTGFYNRRFLDGDKKTGLVGMLESSFDNALRRNEPLSVIMLDVDYFKTHNDTFGHQVGDDVLRAIANVIRANLRSSDFGIRYGGDEFHLLLPITDIKEVQSVANRIRQEVSKIVISGENIPEGKAVKDITVSMGVATYDPTNEDSFINDENRLTYAADKAVYLAKDNGRNQVWVAGEEQRPVEDQERFGKTELVYHKYQPSRVKKSPAS